MIRYADTKPCFGFIYMPKAIHGKVFKPSKNYYNMWLR